MSNDISQGLFAMPEPCASQQQGVFKLTEILAAHILEFATLEQVPGPFLRIELGCIGRQAFQVGIWQGLLPGTAI